MHNPVFEELSSIETDDIIDYLEHLGYLVLSKYEGLTNLIERVEEAGHRVVSEEGLYLTDQQLGDIHMLAYSGQREEAIKEILSLVVPAITINTKVLS